MACGPGSPELSKSDMDMASNLCTFTFTFTCYTDLPSGFRVHVRHKSFRETQNRNWAGSSRTPHDMD